MESDSSGKPTEAWLVVAGIGACAALLLIFISVSYTAARSKSATYDEPLHAVSGYVHWVTGDFRLDPEDPALFGYWAAIPHGRNALKLDLDGPRWQKVTQDSRNNQWPYVVATLYRTSGVDGDEFVQRSRFMFVIVGVMLGALIAWWSWQLAGVWAAIFATAMFVFDPNFLAHSPLVKNDVMLAMTMTAMAMALWRFGRRGTWLSLAGISFATAAAVNVKYSGVLCGPIIFLSLLIRALLPEPWNIIGKTLALRWQRLIVVPVVCAVVGIVSYIAIWACFGFRYGPTHDPQLLLDTTEVVSRIKQGLAARHAPPGVTPSIPQSANEPLNATTKVILWIHSSRLLPQAWIYGFLFTYASTLLRSSYLMGQISSGGWWYYFPCTMIFKTPVATLLAMLIGIGATVVMLIKRKPERHPVQMYAWTAACFVISIGIYACSAMASNLNLGLRHILPLYPFIFVMLGAGAATLIRYFPKWGRAAAGVMILGLMVESLAAYPNYIPFFNAPSEVIAGGFKLLGDSNLDWGQDLKLLHKWQQQHPQKLYLSYFGIGDPKAYYVEATYMPGEWMYLQKILDNDTTPIEQYAQGRAPAPGEHCYVAVSVTNLQGIYYGSYYQQLLSYKPVAVLGKSIYVYEFPLSQDQLKNPGSQDP